MWKMPLRGGIVSAIWPRTRLTSAGFVMSAGTRCTVVPVRSISATTAAAAVESVADRPPSTNVPAPFAASQRAISRPKPPSPPASQ